MRSLDFSPKDVNIVHHFGISETKLLICLISETRILFHFDSGKLWDRLKRQRVGLDKDGICAASQNPDAEYQN